MLLYTDADLNAAPTGLYWYQTAKDWDLYGEAWPDSWDLIAVAELAGGVVFLNHGKVVKIQAPARFVGPLPTPTGKEPRAGALDDSPTYQGDE